MMRIQQRRKYRYGSRNHRSKFDANMVRAIRASTESGVALAAQYDVSPAAIHYIKRRITWSWLD